jgi:uncharacterized protein DUF4910/uncharacterized protein DUF2172
MQLAELVRRGVLLPQSRAGVTTVLTRGARQANATGYDAYELMRRLFPLCRSLTGDGVRATFDMLEEEIPITRTEIPSGTRGFDWIVPDEWNIRDAYIADADGVRVVDFRRSSLQVMSYSEPVRTTLPLEELRPRLRRFPTSRTSCPPGPPTTTTPGASASRTGSCSGLRRATTRPSSTRPWSPAISPTPSS